MRPNGTERDSSWSLVPFPGRKMGFRGLRPVHNYGPRQPKINTKSIRTATFWTCYCTTMTQPWHVGPQFLLIPICRSHQYLSFVGSFAPPKNQRKKKKKQVTKTLSCSSQKTRISIFVERTKKLLEFTTNKNQLWWQIILYSVINQDQLWWQTKLYSVISNAQFDASRRGNRRAEPFLG